MNDLKKQIDEELSSARTPMQREVAVSRAKSKICQRSWEEYGGKNNEGVAVFRLARGREVRIGHVEYVEENGVPAVLVWQGKRTGPPAFRIINPPLMVPDSQGSVQVETGSPGRGKTIRKYRGDPVAALAYAMGGASR
jgi:hypothetical protein